MSTQDILKRIQSEIKTQKAELYNAEGLLKLQETMRDYDGEYKLIWSDELLKELENRPQVTLHKSGVGILDEVIGGFREQQVITIGGDTGHGKTSFGMFLVEQYKDLNPLVIPLEQSNEELVQQRKDNGYSIPQFLSPRSLASQVTTEWIEERVVEGIAKYNSKFVLIDHLGYIQDLTDTMRRENAAYRIGQVMKQLKNIAKKWNVIIILLVHISQHDEGKPPSREDIKNSSDIAQESDLVGLIWRKNAMKNKVRIYEEKVMFSIQKNRRTGRNANLGFSFNRTTGNFDEDNGWVAQMEEMAKAEVAFDDV